MYRQRWQMHKHEPGIRSPTVAHCGTIHVLTSHQFHHVDNRISAKCGKQKGMRNRRTGCHPTRSANPGIEDQSIRGAHHSRLRRSHQPGHVTATHSCPSVPHTTSHRPSDPRRTRSSPDATVPNMAFHPPETLRGIAIFTMHSTRSSRHRRNMITSAMNSTNARRQDRKTPIRSKFM